MLPTTSAPAVDDPAALLSVSTPRPMQDDLYEGKLFTIF